MSTVVLFIKNTCELTGAEGGCRGRDWLIRSGRQAYDFLSDTIEPTPRVLYYCMTGLLVRNRRGRVPRHIGRRHTRHRVQTTPRRTHCTVTRTTRCRLHRLPRHAPARSPDYSIVARSTVRRCFLTTIRNRYLLYNSEQFILYIFVTFSTIYILQLFFYRRIK